MPARIVALLLMLTTTHHGLNCLYAAKDGPENRLSRKWSGLSGGGQLAHAHQHCEEWGKLQAELLG